MHMAQRHVNFGATTLHNASLRRFVFAFCKVPSCKSHDRLAIAIVLLQQNDCHYERECNSARLHVLRTGNNFRSGFAPLVSEI